MYNTNTKPILQYMIAPILYFVHPLIWNFLHLTESVDRHNSLYYCSEGSMRTCKYSNNNKENDIAMIKSCFNPNHIPKNNAVSFVAVHL